MLVWIVMQLAALALATARVRLWAKFPGAGETLALDELLVVQFVGSSLLFPFLCRDSRSVIAVICAGVLMIAVAGFLSFCPLMNCVVSAGNLAVWVIALGVWGKVVGRRRSDSATKVSQPLGVAVFTTLNLSGAVLAYFAAESGASSQWFIAVPMLSAIHLARDPTWWGLFPVLTILVLGVIAQLATRGRFSTAVFH
jgi:hypothetical protein